MREIVDIFFSLVEGFFLFNSNEPGSQKIKKVVTGIIIFLILMSILIALIVYANQPEVTTITR